MNIDDIDKIDVEHFNPDAMTHDQLMHVRNLYDNFTEAWDKKFGVNSEDGSILAHYILMKACAINCRLEGKIHRIY